MSQFLKQALTWKDHKDASVATISSLDASNVKQKCRLSLNLNREEHRASGPRTETLHVKSQRGRGPMRGRGQYMAHQSDGRLEYEYTEVNLSSELYLAPEMMYASLDLAGMIVEATKDLPSQFLKDCFSHILVQGGFQKKNPINNNIIYQEGTQTCKGLSHGLVVICEKPCLNTLQ